MAKEASEGIKLQKRIYKQDFRGGAISYNSGNHLPASLISCAVECVEKIDVGTTSRPCLEITRNKRYFNGTCGSWGVVLITFE